MKGKERILKVVKEKELWCEERNKYKDDSRVLIRSKASDKKEEQ